MRASAVWVAVFAAVLGAQDGLAATVLGVRTACDSFFCGEMDLRVFSFDDTHGGGAKDVHTLIPKSKSSVVRGFACAGASAGSGTGSAHLLLFDPTVGHSRLVTVDASGSVAKDIPVRGLTSKWDTAVHIGGGSWAVTTGGRTEVVSATSGTVRSGPSLYTSSSGFTNGGTAGFDSATGISYQLVLDPKGGVAWLSTWNVTAGSFGASSPHEPYGTGGSSTPVPVFVGFSDTDNTIVAGAQTLLGFALAKADPKTYTPIEVASFTAFVGLSPISGEHNSVYPVSNGVSYISLTDSKGMFHWIGFDLTTKKQVTDTVLEQSYNTERSNFAALTVLQ